MLGQVSDLPGLPPVTSAPVFNHALGRCYEAFLFAGLVLVFLLASSAFLLAQYARIPSLIALLVAALFGARLGPAGVGFLAAAMAGWDFFAAQ